MISDAKYGSTKSNGGMHGSSAQSSAQQTKLMSAQVPSGPPSMNSGGPMVQTAVIGTGAGSKMMAGSYQPIKSIMNYNANPHHHYHHTSNYMMPAPINQQMHYHHQAHHIPTHAHHLNHHHHAMSMLNGGVSMNGGQSSINGNGGGMNGSNMSQHGPTTNSTNGNGKKYSSKTLASSSSSSTNSSTSSTGSVNVKFSGFFKDKIDEREKYLTAKYPNHQMALIKKRLKVEFWIDEQVKNLFNINVSS